jgi:uncharacterized peroxidase-related enzyme
MPINTELAMAYIALSNDFPGIIGLLFHKPSIGRPLHALAQAVLRGPSSMSAGERELVAAHVSRLNACTFCERSHTAVATALLNDGGAAAACVLDGADGEAGLGPRMKALLDIAAHVQQGGRAVTAEDIERAKSSGASDEDIHDTVAVAALFCLLNRYVDGLGTETPVDPAFYDEVGDVLAKGGYRKPSRIGRYFVGRMVRKFAGRDSQG